MSKAWTEDELRSVVRLLPVSASLVRNEHILAVSDALVEVSGMPRTVIEGRNYYELLPPEERHRVRGMDTLRSEDADFNPPPMRLTGIEVDGQKRSYLIHQRRFPPADGGEPYVLVTHQVLVDSAHDLGLAESLVHVAAELTATHSEGDVYTSAINGLRALCSRAAFFRYSPADGSMSLQHATGEVAPPARALVEEALRDRVPVFSPEVHPSVADPDAPGGVRMRVHLPVLRGSGDPEVLVLEGSRFETAHVSLLALFARQLSAALESARLVSETERRNRELSLLLELARTTAGTLELPTILDAACDSLVKLLDASHSFVVLYDAQAETLRGAASSLGHREFFRTVAIRLDDPDSVVAEAGRTRATVEVEDVRARGRAKWDLVSRFGEQALLAVPLLARDELVGVVMVDESRRTRRWGPAVVALAEAIAGQLALSVQNARLYDSLRQSYAQLEATRAEMVKRERLAALGELSAIVAHEVRNPLGVMFNAVGSLRRMLRDDPRAADAGSLLEIACEECERLDALVTSLLDYSRPLSLSVSPEEVGPLLSQTVSRALSALPDASSWNVRLEVEDGLPRAELDARLFRQALENLLMNALQAMPGGGQVEVHASSEGPSLRVDVRDHGPGLAPGLAARIFEPFFTTKAKGTGLGLAVVRRIAEDHGGEVAVAPAPGQGTVFTLRLKFAPGEGRAP
ncbi:MAG: GAF domain-containing protein [Deltaproteobacteria bacterium]|nr:GAF domain-containing protein [Deltaproteobacteria bacterium]